MLGHDEIVALVDNGTIEHADAAKVGQVSYDLTTRYFYAGETSPATTCTLLPGNSVFVDSTEIISLPADVVCRVSLRNSRIRQGLALDAPIYFPTHKTRVFFRVTNLSDKAVALSAPDGIAALTFERVDGGIGKPYTGAFADELDWRNMATYEGTYKAQMREVEDKVEQAKDLERRMYGNILTLMAVFVSVFTLVNVNITSGLSGMPPQSVLVLNLSTVGSMLAFMAVLCAILERFSRIKRGMVLVGVLCALSVAAFIAASVCAAML